MIGETKTRELGSIEIIAILEARSEWCKALESGDYAQTGGTFRGLMQADDGTDTTVYGYCCLGLACEIHDDGHWSSDHGSNYEIQGYEDGGGTFLPVPVAEKLGLDRKTRKILARMNDGGMTFAEIAKFVRVALPQPTKFVYAKSGVHPIDLVEVE